MEISLVSSVFPYPKKGVFVGIERFVSEYSAVLAKKGHKVKVITTYWNGGKARDEYNGIDIYRVRDSSISYGKIGRVFDLHYTTFGRNVLKCREIWNSDIIHAISTLVTTKKIKERGVPVVSHFHHKAEMRELSDYLVVPFHIRNEKIAYSHSDAIITMSRANERVLISDYGVDKSKVKIIPHGVDINKYYKKTIEKENFIILFAGALIPRKGVRYLIEAFGKVSLKHKKTKLIIIGEGSEKKKLKSLSEKLNLNVEFTGLIEDNELLKYLNIADVFVLPSLKEGFGQAIVEAMACSLPVIASNTTAIPEVVGDAGILVRPKDSRALADAIIYLIEDEKFRKELGIKGRRRVEKYFSWEKVVEKAINIYEEIVEKD